MSNSPLMNDNGSKNSPANYQNLNSDQDYSLLRINQLAAISCCTSMSIIGFEHTDMQWFKNGIGIGFSYDLLLDFIRKFSLQSAGLFEFSDLSKADFPTEIATFFDTNNIKYLAGIQLVDHNDKVIGVLLILENEQRLLTEDQKKVLALLAEEASAVIKERNLIYDFSSFEKLFNLSNDLICVAGVDGFFKKINPSFSKVLGWSAETFLTRSLYEMVHPEDLESTKMDILKLSNGETSINFSHRFLHENGSYRILEWVATPDQKTGDIYAIARDITVVSMRDMELEQREKRQRVFFENSQGFMCTHNMEGKLLTVNRAGATMLGYSSQEIEGMSLYDLIPDFRHEAVDLYLKAIRTEGKLSSQMITRHKNGELFIWMFNNVLEKSENEEGYYVIGNAIDITKRVKLEEDLRQTQQLLVETEKVAKVGGWSLDLKHQKVTWTPMTKQIHELDPDYEPDLATGIKFYKEGPSRASIIAAIDSSILEGKSWDLELQLVTNLGNEIWVRAKGNSEFRNGVCKRVFGTLQDIDDSKKSQLQLQRTQKLAEEASVAKSEFLANMSHEIRTPLNGVIGFTDLVLKTNLNETQHQYLSIVNQSGNALLSIINDILDFSKIEAGRLELDVEKCDLYEICSQATDIISYQVQSKGLEMLLNISPELRRFVYADSVRLKQILVNLLGNASKFTENGEIELKVEILEQNGDEHTIRFAVRDTGIGINPDKKLKIFEAFSQEDSSTTKKYGGTGLGLTISNSLLGLMDSRLQLESELGRGSTFYFDVILPTEEGERIEWFDIEELKNVLIVDDNENNRLIVRQMLLLKNIQSKEASNGFEALQLVAKGERFDVILMDYHMPFMDGLETIRKIRDNFSSWNHEQPIMLLHSSSDDHKIIDSCRELRVHQRLIKPLKIQEFYQSLARLYTSEAYAESHPVDEATNSLNQFTVLVAEDNLVNMLLAKTIIKKIAPNAKVVEVTDGLAALEYCQKQLPDIVLMDVQMPIMNGYDATKSIRLLKNNVHIPIIAFTAGNVKGEREKCLDAGMDDFVIKPIVEETVASIFYKWLDMNVYSINAFEAHRINEDNLHYDPVRLQEYTDSDPIVLEQILAIVKSELYKSLISLKEVIQKKELTKINEAGHKLYGTAISAGMNALAKMASDFENLDCYDENQVNSMSLAIEVEINHVLKIMK